MLAFAEAPGPADAAVRAPSETVLVRGDRVEGIDPGATSASVTVIAIDGALPASTDVATAVESASGVTVQRLGGLGDWATVGIRGSSARQVVVALDGVPLNPDGAGAVNLAELPLRAFQRIEVYRGAAPAEHATSAMGGVVNLVSGEASSPPSVSVGLGSLRTGRLHADAGASVGRVDALLAVDGFSTAGAFRYFDDQRTPYNPRDDRVRVRENNDTHQAHALGRIRVGDRALRLTLLDSFLWRAEGVPGPISVPTGAVRYGVSRNLGVAQVDAQRGATTAQGRLWGQWREERFDDRAAEIGLGRQWTRDTTTTVGGRGHVVHALGAPLTASLTADAHLDRYHSLDRLEGRVDKPRTRWSSTLGAQVSVRDPADRLLVQPLVQGQMLTARDPDTGERSTTWAFTPRLGALWRPVEGLALKANIGRYLRPPDFMELFGDRGAFQGRADLRPEQGWQGDLGARWALPAADPLRGTLELTLFATASTDLIAYVQNGQRIVIPVNIGRARVLGVESAATFVLLEWVESQSNLTASDARNLSDLPAYAGNRLPRVPGVEAYQRLAVRPPSDRWRLTYTFSLATGEYWDATNWFRATPRALHGLSARVAPHPAWSIEAEVLNLTDRIVEVVPRNPLNPSDPARILQSVTDFSGYPLPGRTVLATVRWQPQRKP